MHLAAKTDEMTSTNSTFEMSKNEPNLVLNFKNSVALGEQNEEKTRIIFSIFLNEKGQKSARSRSS